VSRHRVHCVAVLLLSLASLAAAVETDSLRDELARIFGPEKHYEPEAFGPARWLLGGEAYTTLEPSASIEGSKDIVRYESGSGKREVLVDAKSLVPPGETKPLEIKDYAWSEDRTRLLVFTNSKRVWRRDTRGDYWVLDLESRALRKLGGVAPAATLMFAKFSPDGTRVAYVHENDIYVEAVATGAVTRLTQDGSPTSIRGTSDWVYEEELGVRDGFRWSPDGRRIAYWSFDSTGVGEFTLINDTDSLYPTLTRIPYPKVGTTNSAVRIGVVSSNGGETSWIKVPGDPRNTYVASLDWAKDDHVLLQHLNRLQNTNDLLRADATSGEVESLFRDQSDTWVEVVDELTWLKTTGEYLWLSEKDGFRHAYRVGRSDGEPRLMTRFDADVIRPLGVDPGERWFYFTASPDDATQEYLYRASLEGSEPPERLTPRSQPGTHGYDLSPDRKWAFHTYSRFDQPPRVELVRLPDHNAVRILVDNQSLTTKLTTLLSEPVEFFRLPIEPDVVLDSWMLKPPGFDPSRRYPLIVHVYGEPAGQTVLDRWGGNQALFHRALAREGYVVASFDNRGTPAPRGAAWRKIIYGTVGDLSSRDQAAAVRALVKGRPYVDPERVAIWGWSGGGSNTLNAMFRFPDVYKVGVSVAPVPDQTLYDTIYQERYMGLPQENEAGYKLGSPIHFAEGLNGRLLIVHGSGDDNVHYQGTERLVNRLVQLGKRFDLMVYPNRSHAISEAEGTSLHIYSLIARYLIENLAERPRDDRMGRSNQHDPD
jgi:dipeptidyl-peptidase-4